MLAHGFVPALSAHAFPVLFAIGLHRRLGLGRPRLEGALVAAALLPAAARVAVPPLYVPLVDGLWWFVALGIGFYLLRLVLLGARDRRLERAGVLLAGTLIVLAAGVHDLASLLLGRALVGVFLFPYAPGVLAFCTVAMLVASVGGRLGEAQRLNVELEDRVEARRRELAGSYTRMAELERHRAVAAERERLMRDMHDGTGGALVSAIAMAEAGGAAPAAVAEVLRDALADLRLSIDSLDPSEPDLASLLGAARARLEPRFEGGAARIVWEVREVPAPAGFGPGSALQVLRIFQEAVVNAMRHAKARTVTVRTGVEREPDGRAWVDDRRRRRRARLRSRGAGARARRRARARQHAPARGGAAAASSRWRAGRPGAASACASRSPGERTPPLVAHLDQAAGERLVDGLGARAHRQLPVEAAHVGRHGVGRDREEAGDLGVGEALDQEVEHLALALGERRRIRVDGRAGRPAAARRAGAAAGAARSPG